MRINHNVAAQLANVNLKKVERRQSNTLASLSSGYKINKAADDSSGLAISNKMRTQIRALDQASRNADDGQSIIQTAEGSLSEIESLLQRTRELSVQAANDTFTIDDRAAAQKEMDSLLNEIDRIAGTTEFNGKKLLDGTCTRAITSDKVDIVPVYTSDKVEAGEYKVQVTAAATAATATLNYTIPTSGSTSVSINGNSIKIDSSDTSESVRKKVLEVTDLLGIDITSSAAGQIDLQTRAKGVDQEISVKREGESNPTVSRGTDAQISLESGFSAEAAVSSNGENVTITGNDGFKMQLQTGSTGECTLMVYDAGPMSIQIGANETQNIQIEFPKVSCQTLLLREQDGDDMINLCSSHGATSAISTFDAAIASISEARSKLGAYQNRLETTAASLDVTSENITDAMSRIMDTDMADAMTQYTQQNVLTQATTSMLAQANNRPQQVMSLLQG